MMNISKWFLLCIIVELTIKQNDARKRRILNEITLINSVSVFFLFSYISLEFLTLSKNFLFKPFGIFFFEILITEKKIII